MSKKLQVPDDQPTKKPVLTLRDGVAKARFIITSLTLLAFAFIALGIVYMGKNKEQYAHSMANWQDADSSPGYPMVRPSTEDSPIEYWSAEFDPNLAQIPSLDRYRIPLAPVLTAPMGAENGAFTYDAQPFFEENKERGGHHLGSDLNGIGGQHTDLGDPVFAAGNGLVLYTGEPSKGWGKMIIVVHRMSDGRMLQSMYAHLHTINTYVGAIVARGSKIGTVGTGNGNYYAHLHFEMRESSGLDYFMEKFPSVILNGGYSDKKFDRLDAEKILVDYAPKNQKILAPSVLALVLAEENSPRQLQLDAKSAEKLGEIMSQPNTKK